MALLRISGYAHVAGKYGLEEAIFLDSIMYWYSENRANDRNYRDGRWWTYNTLRAFGDMFPWWSGKQLRRVINSCKEQGAILTGDYNRDGRDRTVWYTPSDDLLALYGDECICPNGQMHLPKRAAADAQTGTPLPCSYYHVATDNDKTTVPPAEEQAAEIKKPKAGGADYKPDWFDAFWARYPRKDNKQVAYRAWCKLRPSKEVCRQMSAALERDKQSRQWTKDNGDYIPLPSTWINQRRWENEGVDTSQLPAARGSPGTLSWAPDPEVMT